MSATLDGSSLACAGTVSAAGVTVPVHVHGPGCVGGRDAVVLNAVLPIAHSKFGMTWQQIPGMVKDAAQGTVTARFVRP